MLWNSLLLSLEGGEQALGGEEGGRRIYRTMGEGGGLGLHYI